jgi:hypothetical protein
MGDANHVKNREAFHYTHIGKNLLLLLLSIVTIPISAVVVFINLIISAFNERPKDLQQNGQRKTILVTGVSMTKGLAIARNLSKHTPHRIIGADISSFSPGRFSNAITKYYRLDTPHGDDAEPYIDSILSVIQAEKVNLWISCSSVVAAVEDGQVVRLAQASAKQDGRTFEAIQFNEDVVEKFHEKDKFIEYISSLNLNVPESHRCTSADEALDVLLRNNNNNTNNQEKRKDSKFILKPIGVDDHARTAMMTLLPFASASETTSYVKSLSISKTNPFQLQSFIRGSEYCTHALIIRGHVKAFTSCPSSELLMHYAPLPAYSNLSQEMLKFTEKVALDGGDTFSGHLSFDFLVDGEGEDVVLYPIECNPRAHTAVVAFNDTPEMSDAYLSIFEDAISDYNKSTPVYPKAPMKSYFWVGHDVLEFGILPVLDVLSGCGGWAGVREGWRTLAQHVLYWRDGTLTVEDPLPFLVLYHLYWPAKFLVSLRTGKKWSRINVSTTKMFEG